MAGSARYTAILDLAADIAKLQMPLVAARLREVAELI